jgi:hypothetical protein
MNPLESTIASPTTSSPDTPRAGTARYANASMRAVCGMLESLRGGSLAMHLADGDALVFGRGAPIAAMHLNDQSLFDAVLTQGDIGLAETYIDGHWDSPDLPRLLTLLADNRESLSRAVYGSFFRLLVARIKHALNANTRSGSRRNIMAHYDLGNDFYQQWLDPTMSYSAALYSSDDSRPMAAAQLAKYQAHPAPAGREARRPDSGNWLRLGWLCRNRRARSQCRRAWGHTVTGAARMGAGAHAGSRPDISR